MGRYVRVQSIMWSGADSIGIDDTGLQRELELESEGEAGKVNIPRVPRMSEFEREIKKREEETWEGMHGCTRIFEQSERF